MHMPLAVRMNLDLDVTDVHLLAEDFPNPILNVAILHEKHLVSYDIIISATKLH
jgi:hypothetical protein